MALVKGRLLPEILDLLKERSCFHRDVHLGYNQGCDPLLELSRFSLIRTVGDQAIHIGSAQPLQALRGTASLGRYSISFPSLDNALNDRTSPVFL